MNNEAERGVLSAFINLDEFVGTIPFKLTEEDFQNSTNQLIAKVLLNIINSGQKPNRTQYLNMIEYGSRWH